MAEDIPRVDGLLGTSMRANAETKGLLGYLRVAMALATEVYQSFRAMSVCVEEDPDVEGEAFIVIDIPIRMPVEEAVRRRRQYTERWVAAIPLTVIGEIRTARRRPRGG